MEIYLNLTNAKGFLESLKNSLDKEVSPRNKDIIRRYIQDMMNDTPRKSNHTILYNIQIVKFLLEHVTTDYDKLSRDDIDDLKTALSEWKRNDGNDVSEVTVKQYKIGIRRFLRWCGERYQDKEQLYFNLAKQLKLGKVEATRKKEVLTDIEIKQMIMTAVSSRDKAIITTLYESGCRIGEVIQCKIKDFKMFDGYGKLHFPDGKTGERTVTLVNAAFAIDFWLRNHPQANNPEAALFVTLDGKKVKQLAYTSMYCIIKKLAKQAGITKNVHPHIFRHTAATNLAKKWTEPQMKQYLGWSANSNMPAVYIHLNDKDMEKAVLEMNGLVEKVKESDVPTYEACPRCRKLNSSDFVKCYNCGLPLTKEAREEDIEFANNALLEAFTAFLESPETKAKIKEFSNQ